MRATLKKVIIYLKKIVIYLEKKTQEINHQISLPINTLAPKILTDENDLNKIQPYLNSLKQAIDSEYINNIAVTGSYGSGKSTILKTFQHFNKYHYLNISLASFKDNKEETVGKNDDAFERRLEISILQQMFYHVKPSIIPDSRFKRIINITSLEFTIYIFFIISWIFSALVLFKFGYVEKLNPDKMILSQSLDWITITSLFFFFIGIGFLVKNTIRFLNNSKISKINIKGELELGESIDKSVFNQHLEEILYFFERTHFNVVIIEDVDRFNSTEIFTKLREINILVNNSNLIKRSVKFIYAIKDEMFNDKNERVKFFEFIIPVIPFINPSNASDQLSKLISSANLKNVLSSDFTSDIVTFIDDIDMRLLINIFQEYQLYKNILSAELKQDNLLAITVYKNMFPDDFGELPKRRGKLYKFISDKPKYLKNITSEFNSQIDQIDAEIIMMEKQNNISIKELRSIYINRIVSKLSFFHSFKFDTKQVSLLEATEDVYFKKIQKGTGIIYMGYVVNYGTSREVTYSLNFSDIEKEVSTDLTYQIREKILIDKENNQTNVLKGEKEKIKAKIAELESKSLQEIFEKVDITPYLNEFNDSLLIRNLLLNGYIDEHYDDYISLFHEVSLTKGDFTFERKVKSGINVELDYNLTNIENLLKRIPDKYFTREAILNYNLLSFLLENESKYTTKIDNFYKSLCVDNERQFQFIYGFTKLNTDSLSTFVKKLCHYKPTIWQYLNTKSDLPDDEFKDFIRLLFDHSEKESILRFSEVDSLVLFIEQMDDFFNFCLKLNQTKNIESFISTKKIRIQNLDLPEDSQKPIYDFILNNYAYSLNEHNIATQISIYKGDYNSLKTAHYTTILKSDLPKLELYVGANINNYVKNVLLNINENTDEEEQTLIELLNNRELNLDLKTQLLKKQKCVVNSIESIEDIEVKGIIFSNNKLTPSWENVYNYYDNLQDDDEEETNDDEEVFESVNFDEILVNFLNEKTNYEVLSKIRLETDNEIADEYIDNISQKLINCDAIETDAYKELISSITNKYDIIEYDLISSAKMEILIDKGILTLSSENFVGLKKKETNKNLVNKLHIRLVEFYQDTFVKNYSELPMEKFDWYLVFNSASISIENKIFLIKNLNEETIISNKIIAESILKILPHEEYLPLSYGVIEYLFNVDGSIPKKITLLNLHFDYLKNSQVQSLIEKLDGSYKKIFQKQCKPHFPNTMQNDTLFSKLKERNLIIRYELAKKSDSLKVTAKY